MDFSKFFDDASFSESEEHTSKQKSCERTDQTAKAMLGKIRSFIESVDKDNLLEASQQYNDNDYLGYVVNALIIVIKNGLGDTEESITRMKEFGLLPDGVDDDKAQRVIMDMTKAMVTHFLLTEVGKKSFSREF